ncbi:dipeptidase PepV [Halothermothrix orenii]|uniref:Xaa-His dipeptidase n=1 Tax=Halothermothrix orenii (strain H 168 / OCM 544 / DSM 9562) TaxID=373903 RepID=B8CWA7_HALOH|nr:dipeptidase PepV [Halothermothrix orenii]ACL69576.1 Xaa-His dipeptidase [Halothermothrix orenii H 168]
MRSEVNSKIDSLKEDIIKSTQELVKIRSVEEKGQEGKPFGEGVSDALEKALEIGRNLGLKTGNVDGYAGFIEIGCGKEMVGILCHLDVVPEGSGWTYPPYGAEIHNNKIYGRGTLDNKGPAVAALYAMKAVNDLGFDLNKRVRLILGTDEESGWEGLKYYLEKEEIPDSAFSPDAEYPVILGEKGILNIKIKSLFNNENNSGLVSIKGGNAPNMVPDYCEAVFDIVVNHDEIVSKLNEFKERTGFKLEVEKSGESLIIKSYGKSAHGSLPEDGHNAISQLMVFLSDMISTDDALGKFIKFYKERIGMEYYGESIGCHLRDDVSGPLTFNVGMVNINQNSGEIIVNIRYPVTLSRDKVLNGIKQIIDQTEFRLEEMEHMEPLYVPKNDPLVQKLMKVYREFTGDDRDPITIGGGTYARAVEKAVAFGPIFPGQPELAHQKDEYIDIDDLIKNAKIYANAIIELAT